MNFHVSERKENTADEILNVMENCGDKPRSLMGS